MPLIGLLILLIIGIITIAGISKLKTIVINIAITSIFLSAAITAIFFRLLKFDKSQRINKKICIGVMLLILAVSVIQFAVIEGVVYKDNAAMKLNIFQRSEKQIPKI